jgi:threonine dehydrogenase-like Zn-dependent dehydrogenase
MRTLLLVDDYSVRVADTPAPEPGPLEALLRVSAAGICGSDVHGVASHSPRRQPPLVMGHEFTGTVVAVGAGAPEALVGSDVAVNPQVPCGVCNVCRSGRDNVCQDREMIGGSRPGGFGEFVAVPVRCLHILPPGLDPALGVFAEPLATCIHAARLLERVAPRSALILGAGTIGVLAAQVMRLVGATHIIVSDIDSGRRQAALAVADVVAAPDELSDAVASVGGIDVSIDAAGTSSTRHASVQLLQTLGTALWLGMHDQDSPVPAFEMVVREQRVQGSFAYTNPEFARAVDVLASGQIRPAVSTRSFSIEQSAAAFTELLAGTATGHLKSIIDPGQGPT